MKVVRFVFVMWVIVMLLGSGRQATVVWAQKALTKEFGQVGVSPSAKASGFLHMFSEPIVTQGDSNVVGCNDTPDLKIFQISTDQTNWESRSGTFNSLWTFSGLSHGSEYFYRVITITDTSNVVSSTQDTVVPVVQVYSLPPSTTDAIVSIRFKTWDPLCGSVQKAILYYRSDSTSAWSRYDSLLIDPQRVAVSPIQAVEDSVAFDIGQTGIGDGYYEFYLSGVDSAWAADNTGIVGNCKIPLPTTQEQIFTWFDTQEPGSKIFSQLLLPCYNQSQIPIVISFSAADSAKGARGYWSGLEEVTAFFNYKVDFGGPYLVQDVQIATYPFTGEILSVDSTFYFTATQDGIYEFYTLAKDNFGNQEDKPQLPLPTVIFDTEIPQINQIVLLDQTSSSDTVNAAQPGWTNSNSIFVYALGMEDLLKDDFHSGVDSLLVAQNAVFTLNKQRYKVTSSGAVLNYALDGVQGEEHVFAKVFDYAKNESQAISNTIILDTIPPSFDVFDITSDYTTQPQISINVQVTDTVTGVGELYKLHMSEDPTFPSDKTVYWQLPAQKQYNAVIPFTVTFTPGRHFVYGRVRDKAGNWSEVWTDSVSVDSLVQLNRLTLQDLTDSADTLNYPDPGWSDSLVVKARISYAGVLKKIILSETPSFTVSQNEYIEWESEGDSVAVVVYDHLPKVGCDTLWCQLLGPNLTDSSAVKFATIQVDTTSPYLQDFVMYHTFDDPETTYVYTNNLTVHVRSDVSGDFLAKMKFWEPEFVSVFYPCFVSDTTYTIRTPGEGEKQVFCAVRDSAGNWSNYSWAQILYDVTPPTLQSFQLSDLSTPGPSDSVITDTSLVEVTLEANDVAPGKLYKFVLAQSADLTANQKNYYWDSGDVQVEGSIITLDYSVDLALLQGERIQVWCKVVDSAGNSSLELANDDILYSGPIRLQVTLYDLSDTTDTRFSPTDQVGVHIQRIAGLVEEVAITDDPFAPKEFFPFPAARDYLDTLFVFHSDSLGYTATLYCLGINSAGRYDSTWASIRIDKVPPPGVSALWIEANSPRGDKLWTHRRDVNVHVEASDDYGEIARIDVSEDSTFQEFEWVDIPEGYPLVEQTVPFTLSGGNELKRVYVRVHDRAEHSGAVSSCTIVLDFDPVDVVTNHPNPFNPNIGQSTTIVVKTNGKSAVGIRIYDVFGNLIRTMFRSSGQTYYEIGWDGRNDCNEMVANGGYICVVCTDQHTIKRKIAVLK